ncbi:TnsA endonuclease N-terminal domain-containing protein [Microbulbifer sp. ANSA003]|uniref:TnsA endonuclease N-terminal domain-containing protein n=1 Tax=Microbulbifer sp. ANSA003 TaxID=3243360 RepID=UPI00404337C5
MEKQACTTFESYHEIQTYRSQPYAVRLLYAGKSRIVYPDFEITLLTKKILVDIKYEKNTRNPLFRQRCEALEFFAEQQGMDYILLTEKNIRGQRLLNAQWLLSLSHGKAPTLLTSTVWRWIFSLGQMTFGDLFKLTAPYPQARSVLACLALDGHLNIDWSQPLREQHVFTDIKVGR